MKDNIRGQQTGFPIPLVSAVAVAVAIYVGGAVATEMQSQLPSGPTALCGGGCGYSLPLSMLLIPLSILLALIVGAAVVRRVQQWRNDR